MTMPAGIEKMSKEELWQWFQRSQRAHGELATTKRFLWTTTTGLHQSYVDGGSIPSYQETIELQRKTILGLRTQMQQMHRGYRRKITRLQRALDCQEKP